MVVSGSFQQEPLSTKPYINIYLMIISHLWVIGQTNHIIKITGESVTFDLGSELCGAGIKKVRKRDFPGGPLVKILHFHCGRQGFEPWLGN